MRIYYHLSHYLSHRNSGLEYATCLRALGHEVLLDPAEADSADLAILHDGPEHYGELFAAIPALRRLRTIAFCVWEADILPNAFIEPLRLVREIWTPSHFSQAALLPLFPHTRVLPHIVRRVPASPEQIARMRERLGFGAGSGGGVCRFFSIIDAINPRKNITALLTAYTLTRKRFGAAVQLALKQYRYDLPLPEGLGIVSISDTLEEGEMAALHMLCDAYVSAHHCEGWGLGLSQAMAYGKPLIATGYSGNMEFMDQENSFPIPYTLAPVSEDMVRRSPLFTREMRWAEVDVPAFAARMRLVAEGRVPPDLPAKAAAVARRFGPAAVGELMRRYLAAPLA
jgi:glycosyltransferase involved in cell wall biosynthesis